MTPYLSRCLLGVLVSAVRRLCVPVPVYPMSLGFVIWVVRQAEKIGSFLHICGLLILRSFLHGNTRRIHLGMSAKRERTAVVEAANKRGRATGVAKVDAATKRGNTIINHGAGTMPVDAPAPHGGTRYQLLEDADGVPPSWQVEAHAGNKGADGKLHFPDAPDFCPALTPAECVKKGIFGGCYFHPRGGKQGIFGRDVAIDVAEFPAEWFEGLPPSLYRSRRYQIPTNAYGVKSGFGQAEWEAKGWIHAQDPRVRSLAWRGISTWHLAFG